MDNLTENEFIGEFETMDLSELKKHKFMVAISTGDRSKYEFLCSTIAGPFDFYEMVEKVYNLYKDQVLHAKALICKDGLSEQPKFLDENTIDYIEAKGEELISMGLMEVEVDEEFTCKAGFN